jgi:hypothetical protein
VHERVGEWQLRPLRHLAANLKDLKKTEKRIEENNIHLIPRIPTIGRNK